MVLEAQVLGFHSIKALYIEHEDFKQAVEDSSPYDSLTLQEGFLFYGNEFCISKSLLSRSTSPKMGGDARKVIRRCATCHMAKNHYRH